MKHQNGTSNGLDVLLVEDNPNDVELLEVALDDVNPRPRFSAVTRLSDAVDAIQDKRFDCLLLDLGLPDCIGLETLERALDAIEGVPIIVLTGTDEETLGLEAMRVGAQDYLVKGRVDGHLLSRAIRYAIERNNLVRELRLALDKRVRRATHAEERHREIELEMSAKETKKGNSLTSLEAEYTTLLKDYLLALQGTTRRPTARVRQMAIDLHTGQIRARDIASIHLRALSPITSRLLPSDRQSLVSDARLLLVELLGRLVDLGRDGARCGESE